MHKYCESMQAFNTTTFKPHQKVLTNLDNAQHEAYMIATPVFEDTIYIVQLVNGSIHQIDESDMKELQHESTTPSIPSWITNNAPVTIFFK